MHTIPGYAGLVRIGAGGTATVYRATQEPIGRDVALKIMTGSAVDARTSKQFSREARALGTLGWHPNIVVLFDAAVTDSGVAYIAMEHVAGGSLADRGRIKPQETAQIGVRIAGALHCAHTSGVLHRDVKPANILVDVLGQCKLADFGISGLVDATNTTGGGMTLLHVPPEIIDGGQADIRSDVYALASTMFELLTGRAPFQHDNPEAIGQMLLAIMDDPIPDLRPWGVPNSLADAIEAGMAKSPDDRPATAEAFGRLLQQAERTEGWPATDLPLPGGFGAPAPPLPAASGSEQAGGPEQAGASNDDPSSRTIPMSDLPPMGSD